MLYKDFLSRLKGCPFDKIKKSEIFFSNKSAVVILARAPYSKDHLLVIPKRHVFRISELSENEKKDLGNLIFLFLNKLHIKHENVTVLYREGNDSEVGKSISHLHVHLIPNMKIGAYNINWEERDVYNKKDYLKEIKKLKKELNEKI